MVTESRDRWFSLFSLKGNVFLDLFSAHWRTQYFPTVGLLAKKIA